MQDILLLVLMVVMVISLIELLYILSLRFDIRHITQEFDEKMRSDTNTLIHVQCRDQSIRFLASKINVQLKELRKQKLKLNDGDRELKHAITGLAHDIRTPLSAVSGYLELMETVESEEKRQEYMHVIKERTDTLKQLTEELFQYSLITTAEENPQLTSLSLNSELEIALAGAYGILTQNHIIPDIHITETKIIRNLDHTALQRIFHNILINASRYSDGDLIVVLSENGELCFSNHARGLSKVETERLFDRFYTVRNAKGSTGLGLSIAKHLSEKMGGSIQAVYEDGILQIRLLFPETEK